MILCSFMEKYQKCIYMKHIWKKNCKLKEEGKILRNLSYNFHNSNIYDAGKDIARVCTYMTDICN